MRSQEVQKYTIWKRPLKGLEDFCERFCILKHQVSPPKTSWRKWQPATLFECCLPF